ncbi:MAG: KpsF/GutQ family sugar-phosphate isomerase [Endomicrobia bacterium]|nr:KpsF/GutQ family sugar-phosphate isomerase [Endomicrobiia bacterium]
MNRLSDSYIIKTARNILTIEAKQLLFQLKHIDKNFLKAVKLILELEGKVIVIGVGKSGLVGRKIASTFSSLGISSIFLHPVELLHGDLGVIKPGDIILILSYSGETEEIKKILPVIKNFNLKIISFTSKLNSKLAKFSDVVINTKVQKEACPYNIVPTSSTTAMLALGDALGITVAKIKGFRKEDFAKFHPSGNLGKILNLRVKDIMRKGNLIPKVFPDTTVKEALLVMTSKKLGATTVVDKNGVLVGYFTDGDLRRCFQKGINVLNFKIKDVMTVNPKVAYPDELVIEAKEKMRKFNCDNLPIVDKNRKVVGILDERDILQEGL